LPPMSLLPVVHLDLRISLRIWKNSKSFKCFLGLGWRWFIKKTWNKKSRNTVPLRVWRIFYLHRAHHCLCATNII
jgi:hypothetical protein